MPSVEIKFNCWSNLMEKLLNVDMQQGKIFPRENESADSKVY